MANNRVWDYAGGKEHRSFKAVESGGREREGVSQSMNGRIGRLAACGQSDKQLSLFNSSVVSNN